MNHVEKQIDRQLRSRERKIERETKRKYEAVWHVRGEGDDRVYTRYIHDGRLIVVSMRDFFGLPSESWFPHIITADRKQVSLLGGKDIDAVAHDAESVCGISHASISEAVRFVAWREDAQ